MLDKYKKNRLSLLLCASIFVVNTCVGESDPDEPSGICPINCGDAKLPSNDMRVRFLFPNGINNAEFQINCGGGPFEMELPVRFVVEKPRQVLPAEQTNGEVLGGSKAENTTDTAAWVPVSGVSFVPLMTFGGPVETVVPLPGDNQYVGIATPPSEWCTDACGVGAIKTRVYCPGTGGNDVIVGITSGSLWGTANFQIEAEDEE
ncbi:MAG: hypothetical protein AB8G05_00510 [Oligoflexales bacterium]